MTRVEHSPEVEADLKRIEGELDSEEGKTGFQKEFRQALKAVERHPRSSKILDLSRLREGFSSDEEWERYLKLYVPGGIQGNAFDLSWQSKAYHLEAT